MSHKVLTIAMSFVMMFSNLTTFTVGAEDKDESREATNGITEENTITDDTYDSESVVETNETRSSEGEAYAVLTNDGELIFFRSNTVYTNNSVGTFTDIEDNQYTGKVYSNIETFDVGASDGKNKYRIPWYSNRESIISVRVADKQIINPASLNYWFNNCTNLLSANMQGFYTSRVRSMVGTFHYCRSLTSLDVRGLDTSNVEDMYAMFAGCSSLTSLDVRGFDTSNVEDMYAMFANCSSLTRLDVSGFNTGNVKKMYELFAGCSSLTSLDLSGFDTSNVTTMGEMFYFCSHLTNLNLSSFDTSNVEDMYEMFSQCSSLTKLNLSSFDTSNVTTMSYMFKGCRGLTSLNINGFDTSKVKNMSFMFADCSSLTSLDVSFLDTRNVYDDNQYWSMRNIFDGLDSLLSIKLGNKMIIWNGSAYLPAGTWTNQRLNISLSETELYKQYPSHCNEWAGTWKRTGVNPTSINLNTIDATVIINNTLQLRALLDPENVQNKTINWSSNNTNIATVDSSGLVTGKSIGKAIITATTVNGLTDTCEITVLFADVADASKFFYDPVYWAVEQNITTGTSPATFSPNDKVTRGQIVAFLYRAAGEPPVTGDMPFADVKEGKFYYNAVLWAKNTGITTGTSSTQFSPNENCTRAQIVTFLWRYLNSPEPSKMANFEDVVKGSFYEKAVSWAAENNVTTGTSSTKFSPNDTCTRGQAVTFIYRAVGD